MHIQGGIVNKFISKEWLVFSTLHVIATAWDSLQGTTAHALLRTSESVSTTVLFKERAPTGARVHEVGRRDMDSTHKQCGNLLPLKIFNGFGMIYDSRPKQVPHWRVQMHPIQIVRCALRIRVTPTWSCIL